MAQDSELALSSLEQALDALLVALVALDGLHDIETPTDALDLALQSDDEYTEARKAFAVVFTDLGEALGRDELFFELDVKHAAVVVAATDVGFKLGLAMAANTKSSNKGL